MIGFYIGIFMFIIGIILSIISMHKYNLKINEVEIKERNKIAKRILDEQVTCNDIIREKEKLEKELKQLQLNYENSMQQVAGAKKMAEDLLDTVQQRVAAEEEKLKQQLNHELELKKQQLDNEYDQYNTKLYSDYLLMDADLQKNINNRQKELEEIQTVLNEYKAKQEAINEQIMREEELKNQLDFHRIVLSESDKDDIHYLISIEPNIHNKELLYKLIWSEYIQKPFNKMINANFGSKIPKNVIYCIERISDNKKYIGKTSAEVSRRWTDHIKNSLNIGSIKHQPVHEALYNDWDNFTFSIIEEVKDDKLSEREKFYINFFETDKYGFNIKSGG